MTMFVMDDTSDGRNGTNAWHQEDVVSSEYNVTTTASGAASKTSHFETDLHGNVNILLGGWAFIDRSNFRPVFKKHVNLLLNIFFLASRNRKEFVFEFKQFVCPRIILVDFCRTGLEWNYLEQIIARSIIQRSVFKYFSTIPCIYKYPNSKICSQFMGTNFHKSSLK